MACRVFDAIILSLSPGNQKRNPLIHANQR